ncbi:hypothetical protein K443DRAFT_681037 [Laccaria amethystina LaAM-08-1]|uniref:N-acetyltransferase domain-containing protein n=1 Tax=Laccaria amethystina LaAM-08-1 TaxID=1095629 RepID=A0A0C9WMD9_9AGAR|nr:hypothetical protein K443DRAFT_681037 [Laccaria amethystina LaAM-08-1]
MADVNVREVILLFQIISQEQTIPLRHSVLWPSMAVEHVLLPEAGKGLHLGAFCPLLDSPIAVILLFIESFPIDNNDHGSSTSKNGQRMVRFRKFACDPEFQRRGVGTRLLVYVLSMARSELNATIVWCDARTSSHDWYKRRGLSSFGAKFSKDSVEYIRMRMDVWEWKGQQYSESIEHEASQIQST